MHDETRAPLRFGIAGAGAIARRFCRDVNGHARGAEVVAIAARDQGRADEFARDLGLPHAYGSYEALAASPEVEAVYVAVIHPEHAGLVRQGVGGGGGGLGGKGGFYTAGGGGGVG
uniref:Gfo/Idh/MocA family oxidoreductase n=1 Tax=Aeromonas caviae TaxID=648 RepID=UPI0013A55E7D